jgi:hypothetical protein
MRYFVVVLYCFSLISCGSDPALVTSEVRPELTTIEIEPAPTPTPEVKPYLGIAIDQVFPVAYHDEWKTAEEAKTKVSVPVDDLGLTFQYFKPQAITRDGRTIFRFATMPGFGYWSNVAGLSYLLGSNSKQIYLNSVGPGAVCCTNYWITDVSTKAPRSIFRSEDFGRFRDAMEIFDADGDGIYELVQFDSCMRYFRDDCGSCSPEPRAYFKYDSKLRTYRPAKKILQDFVRDQIPNTEKWLAEQLREFKETENIGTKFDLRRSVIAHVADMLHVGEERKAWEIFQTFKEVLDGEDRQEIKKRLASCKFYQALRRMN